MPAAMPPCDRLKQRPAPAANLPCHVNPASHLSLLIAGAPVCGARAHKQLCQGGSLWQYGCRSTHAVGIWLGSVRLGDANCWHFEPRVAPQVKVGAEDIWAAAGVRAPCMEGVLLQL